LIQEKGQQTMKEHGPGVGHTCLVATGGFGLVEGLIGALNQCFQKTSIPQTYQNRKSHPLPKPMGKNGHQRQPSPGSIGLVILVTYSDVRRSKKAYIIAV
jgi:hypothetical protein